MNKMQFSYRLLIVLLSVFLFASCTDEPIDPILASQIAQQQANENNNNNSGGDFTAKIDGANFVSNNTVSTYSNTVSNGTQLAITGSTSDGKNISIQILNPTIGTRQASNDLSNLLIFQYQDIVLGVNGIYSSLNTTNNTSVGSLTISSFDLVAKKISGTFSFTAYNSLNPTNSKEITTGVINNISFTDTTTPLVTNSVVGTYLLTAFNTSIPTDLNNDGTSSTNQMNETACFNNMLLTLNTDNTFVANSKGIEIGTNGTTQILSCFTDPDEIGTWSLSGNTLTLTYSGSNPDVQIFTVSGNTITATATNGQVVGYDTVSGAPAYLTCDIAIIYNKQ